MEVQVEQEVQWVIEDPHASSCEDTNIVGSRKALVHLTTFLEFYLSLYLIYDSWMCIGYRS
jgi:hypothetical protein